jgi:hypothetical protein
VGGRAQAARVRLLSRRSTNACAACRANHTRRWSSIRRKNIPLLFSCKSVHLCAVPPGKRGGSRSSRNARWDAVDAEAMTDEAGMTRTVKSCGPDAVVLALSSREARLSRATVAKEPFTRELGISRKTIAQGRPGCSGCTCMLVCVFLRANCARDRGCSVHPVFPAPSKKEGGKFSSKPRAQMRRENANSHSVVIVRLVRNCALGRAI